MKFLTRISDGHRVTHALQIVTLAVLVWIGVSLQRQQALTETLIAQENPVSTPYVDTDGMTHTVNTPYTGEGTAAQHKLDLCAAFRVFPPRDPPSWIGECDR